MGAGQIASSATSLFGSGKAASQTANATMTALEILEGVRRDLARKLQGRSLQFLLKRPEKAEFGGLGHVLSPYHG